jgi:hypothetical protein
MPPATFEALLRVASDASNGTCQATGVFITCALHGSVEPAAEYYGRLNSTLPNITLTVQAREEVQGGDYSALDIVLTPGMYLCCGEPCGHSEGTCRIGVGEGGFGAGSFVLGDTVLSHYVTAFHEEFKAVGIAPNMWGTALRRSPMQLSHAAWYASPAVWVGACLALVAAAVLVGKWGRPACSRKAQSGDAPQTHSGRWSSVPAQDTSGEEASPTQPRAKNEAETAAEAERLQSDAETERLQGEE